MKKILLLGLVFILLVSSVYALTEYPSNYLSNETIAIYHFNETTNAAAIDSTGNGHDGTNYGTTNRSSHFPELANATDGGNGHFNVGDSVVFGGNATVCAWLNWEDRTSQDMILTTDKYRIGSISSGHMGFYDIGITTTKVCSAVDYTNYGDIHMCWVWNGTAVNCYVNGSSVGITVGSVVWGTTSIETIASSNTGVGGSDDRFDGWYDELVIINKTLSFVEVNAIFNGSFGVIPIGQALAVNITFPINNTNINDVNIRINVTTNDTTSCSINDTSWDLDSSNTTSFSFLNISAIVEGDYSIFINCSGGSITGNDTVFFGVDRTSPTIVINTNNFFNTTNNTILTKLQSNTAMFNITFTDEVELYSYHINITNSSGFVFYNLTNISLGAASVNFTSIINISKGSSGYRYVSITAWDTHTLGVIDDIDVKDGFNYILFNDKIRIKADNAIGANTNKLKDRYSFEFNYIPLLAPSKKVFYVESDGRLDYLKASKYKAHFVDYKNKMWIDFEGLASSPTITKISDYKYKIEFNHEGDNIVFNSIGELNSVHQSYKFLLDNEVESIVWHSPTTIFNFIPDNNSFSVILNVTDAHRNRTTFYLYNSTRDLVLNTTINLSGDGTAQYNYTFTNLTDVTYYVNASHNDTFNNTGYSTTLTLANILLDNCTIWSVIAQNYTFYDEGNQSRLIADLTGTFNYTVEGTIYRTYNLVVNDKNNFSICIYPSASLTGTWSFFYNAPDYPQRRYAQSVTTIDNTTVATPLYLLNANDGLYARFKTVDGSSNPISGAAGVMRKTIDGNSRIIEQSTTDDSGMITFWQDPDSDYTYTFSKTGFSTVDYTLRVTTTEIITIDMGGGAAAQPALPFGVGISYGFTPTDGTLQNQTNYNFTFNLTSSFWNMTGCVFSLKNGSTVLNSTSGIFNASLCTLGLVYSTGDFTTLVAETNYQLNGTSNHTINKQYNVRYSYEGEFSLKNVLDDLKAFGSAGFNDFTRVVIAFIIIFAIVALAAKETATFRDPMPLIILILVLVWFFSYIGWLTVGYDAIPDIAGSKAWIQQYIIALLLTLVGVAYLAKEIND